MKAPRKSSEIRIENEKLLKDLTGLSQPTTAFQQHLTEWVEAHERSFRAEATDQGGLEIDILDVIGGGLFFEGITARRVKRVLNEHADAKNITVVIDSPGGVVWDGHAIQALLKRHPAEVTVEIVGEAASAASVVAMAGDTVKIHEGAMMMVHRASMGLLGFSTDLREAADYLDKVTDAIIDIYSARVKLSRDEIKKMVEAETWISAKEAVEMGFADEIIPAKGAPKPAPKPAPKEGGKGKNQAPEPAPAPPPEPPPAPEPPAAALPRFASPLPQGARQFALPLAMGIHPPPDEGTPNPSTEETMTLARINAALNLSAEADEQAVVGAIQRLQQNAKTGSEIEQIVGATGASAVGMVRALKEGETRMVQLEGEVETIKINNNRQQFEAARAEGLRDRKLTPATAKLYSERFEADVKLQEDGSRKGDGSSIVADLKGFLAVASRVVSTELLPPTGEGNGGAAGMTEGGRPFEQLTPMERHRLKKDNPDLYTTLRNDAVQREAI